MKIKIIKGDITKVTADVIVNAANTSLLGGGGVDGAIHRAGGKAILDECRKIRARQGNCKVGEAVITTAGNLNAQKVIHTVGPNWNKGKSNEEQKLKSCYLNSLKLADELNFKTIAFPNISTGIYKFPKPLASKIALEVALSFEAKSLDEIIFVCFDQENYDFYISQSKR